MQFSRPESCNGQPFSSPGDLPNPGIKPRSPTLQAHSLPSEPPGKPQNTGIGSLSLLQRIFPTPGMKLGYPALWVDSLPAEPPGKRFLILGRRYSKVPEIWSMFVRGVAEFSDNFLQSRIERLLYHFLCYTSCCISIL